MAEPSPNCIDVYAGAKEVGCRRVSYAMRTDPLFGERGELVNNSFDVSFYKIVDSESSCRLPTTVEEETLGWGPPFNQGPQFSNGLRPKGAPPHFVSFSPDADRRVISVANRQIQIADQRLGRFIGTGTGVVKEQQERVISPSLSRTSIRSFQQCIHFRLLQVRYRRMRSLFEGH